MFETATTGSVKSKSVTFELMSSWMFEPLRVYRERHGIRPGRRVAQQDVDDDPSAGYWECDCGVSELRDHSCPLCGDVYDAKFAGRAYRCPNMHKVRFAPVAREDVILPASAWPEKESMDTIFAFTS